MDPFSSILLSKRRFVFFTVKSTRLSAVDLSSYSGNILIYQVGPKAALQSLSTQHNTANILRTTLVINSTTAADSGQKFSDSKASFGYSRHIRSYKFFPSFCPFCSSTTTNLPTQYLRLQRPSSNSNNTGSMCTRTQLLTPNSSTGTTHVLGYEIQHCPPEALYQQVLLDWVKSGQQGQMPRPDPRRGLGCLDEWPVGVGVQAVRGRGGNGSGTGMRTLLMRETTVYLT